MAEFKVVIGTKDGKCVQREVKEAEAEKLVGKKIGEKIAGDDIGLAGYEFELTGGSDYCGFPMRKDVRGPGRKRILAVSGVGLKKKRKGMRQRKTVRGNTVSDKITQINLKVLKEGKEKLGAPKAEAKPAEGEAKAEEKPAEKKEEPKAEEKKEEKKEEAPKPKEEKPAEKKEEPKAEKKE
jgi:small subunit ribosomal protein S6e